MPLDREACCCVACPLNEAANQDFEPMLWHPRGRVDGWGSPEEPYSMQKGVRERSHGSDRHLKHAKKLADAGNGLQGARKLR